MASRPEHPYGRSATDVRRRAQRERHIRRQRIASLIVLSLLVITVAVGAAWAWRVLQRPPAPAAEPPAAEAPAQPGCPDPDARPAAPEDVTVQVLNGTNRTGLAGEVTTQLGERGYDTRSAANGDLPTSPALVRHAPEDYLAAMSVAAQLPEAQLQESEEAEGGVVVLVIGEDFPGLASPDAAQAALAKPVPVPERCG